MSLRRFLSLVLFASILGAPAPAGAGDDSPDGGDVKGEVQERLDAWFEGGLFRVKRCEVLATRVEEESAAVVVRYRADVRFQRDHDLTRLDAVNVGTLVELLGSSSRWTSGVAVGGNRRGDLLRVEGSLVFERAEDGWRAGVSQRPLESAADSAATGGEGALPPELRAQLEELGKAVEAAGDEEGEESFGIELGELVADVECRMAGDTGRLRLASGAPSTEYNALGRGLIEVVAEAGGELHLRESTGSVANVGLLRDGLVDVALVQNDIAHLAHQGRGLFQGRLPMTELRALCSLFPEVVHVVTLADSGIETVADLRGQAVDVGPDESGSRVNAAQVLGLYGVGLTDLGRVQGKPPGDALDDLLAGRIKAAIMTGVYPYPEIARRARVAPLRLVPLTQADVDAAAETAPFVGAMTIPAGSYAGQEDPVLTLGVAALVVAREELGAGQVDAILDAFMGGGETLARHSLQAYFISPASAERGLSIPLHPAAWRKLEQLRADSTSP